MNRNILLCVQREKKQWLLRIAQSLLHETIELTSLVIYTDSQSAMKLAENNEINCRNKHIDMAYHYIRDIVDKNVGI